MLASCVRYRQSVIIGFRGKKGKGWGTGRGLEGGVGWGSPESERIDQNQKESIITDRGDVVARRDWLVWFIRSFYEEGPRFDSESDLLSLFLKICGLRTPSCDFAPHN